jgi:hypothetical protein
MDQSSPRAFDLGAFSERTYTTFVSRARASQRLATRGTLWGIALAVSSTATLAVSIAALFKPDLLGGRAGLWACLFSLLTLVWSLIVATFNYSGRSRDMFHSYRTIQRVSTRAERLASLGDDKRTGESTWDELDAEYQLGLDQSENHTTWDYYRARKPRAGSNQVEIRRERWLRRGAAVVQSLVDGVPLIIIVGSLALTCWVFLNL